MSPLLKHHVATAVILLTAASLVASPATSQESSPVGVWDVVEWVT